MGGHTLWEVIFVKWILEWTRSRSHRHAHWWASTSVSASSRQQKETSGFGSSDGSVPLAETPRNLLSPSHMSPFTRSPHFFSIYPEFTGETAVKKTQEPFSSFVGGCNGKEMVSVPIVSHGKCRSVFRWHQRTYIHSHTHTMGEDRSLGKARKTKESPSVQSLRVGVHERLQVYTLKTLWCFMWKFTRKRLAL